MSGPPVAGSEPHHETTELGETAETAETTEPVAGWSWPWLFGVSTVLLAVVALAGLGAFLAQRDRTVQPTVSATPIERVSGTVTVGERPERSLDPYVGLGTWVDRFDFSPPYAGDNPPVSADDIAEMHELGVRTVYIQASHRADKSPGPTEDPWVLAELLIAAHERDMAVVAWYLPKWEAQDADKIAAMADFEVLGHRFDGIGVDIEYNQGGLEPAERSRRLVALSEEVRAHVGDEPLAAIVLPPVLTDVVNTEFWPEFPWAELAPLYDVWMPMSYWSFRSESSGYNDGFTYNAESTERLREHLGDPDALVHGIGGIGAIDADASRDSGGEPLALLGDLEAFVDSLVATRSIGGSMYDWATMDPAARVRQGELFATGPGADLWQNFPAVEN